VKLAYPMCREKVGAERRLRNTQAIGQLTAKILPGAILMNDEMFAHHGNADPLATRKFCRNGFCAIKARIPPD